MHANKLPANTLPIDEIIAWGWIAGTVLMMLTLSAALSFGTDASPLLRSFGTAVPAFEQASLLPLEVLY
jgi:hypothetical protein